MENIKQVSEKKKEQRMIAYLKGLQIIESCDTPEHTQSAKVYVHNFKVQFTSDNNYFKNLQYKLKKKMLEVNKF